MSKTVSCRGRKGRLMTMLRILSTTPIQDDEGQCGHASKNSLSPILSSAGENARDCGTLVSSTLDSPAPVKTTPCREYNAEPRIVASAAPPDDSSAKYVTSFYELLAILPGLSRFEGYRVRFCISGGQPHNRGVSFSLSGKIIEPYHSL
jgi:hypothetical protein